MDCGDIDDRKMQGVKPPGGQTVAHPCDDAVALPPAGDVGMFIDAPGLDIEFPELMLAKVLQGAGDNAAAPASGSIDQDSHARDMRGGFSASRIAIHGARILRKIAQSWLVSFLIFG